MRGSEGERRARVTSPQQKRLAGQGAPERTDSGCGAVQHTRLRPLSQSGCRTRPRGQQPGLLGHQHPVGPAVRGNLRLGRTFLSCIRDPYLATMGNDRSLDDRLSLATCHRNRLQWRRLGTPSTGPSHDQDTPKSCPTRAASARASACTRSRGRSATRRDTPTPAATTSCSLRFTRPEHVHALLGYSRALDPGMLRSQDCSDDGGCA
jgi:hypothetical protein